MVEDKIKKYILDKTIKYEKKCLITLSGLPGCGKTTCARILSHNLKFFIISNDFFRDYYQEKNNCILNKNLMNKKVSLINLKRLLILFTNKVSVVLDSDINDENKFKKIEFLTKLFNYEIIKIKINTKDDSINLNRIKNRKEDIGIPNLNIIGDKNKLKSYDSKEYYKIKNEKPQIISNDYFNYVLNNNDEIIKYLNEVNKISEEIKNKLLIKE